MTEHERKVLEGRLRAAQRLVRALEGALEGPTTPGCEAVLPPMESMRTPWSKGGPDGWGPNSGDRSHFSSSKRNNSRNRKHGKVRRVKAPHKR
ncbi:MAG: hypothetical protein EB165_04365 [Euryarchaeota archaeon]|nr:hypothetical protein [Euryarchaeota archaeon]NDB93865.1 hypothetical protein [Euryarchaeota archaeon]